MKYTNIIFDFDGTLVDTRPGIIKAFYAVMTDMGIEPADEKTIGELIGVPLSQFLEVLLKTNDAKIIKKGSELFKKHYDREYSSDNILYPGIPELLENIKENSGSSFVVSNKIDAFLNKILEQHDIRKYFQSTKGTDGTGRGSQKSDYVRDLVEENNLDRAITVIVGDRRDDVVAGKDNLIHTVGITYGYGSREELEEVGAEIVVRDVEGLKSVLME
ncbi:HAD hydrolase-like protein [Candidatus Microgenomates bacterium]|nr:HAD hydrolase-like protein [Candidatus Microgenomates bacterium]